jgi:hypothetical protein
MSFLRIQLLFGEGKDKINAQFEWRDGFGDNEVTSNDLDLEFMSILHILSAASINIGTFTLLENENAE